MDDIQAIEFGPEEAAAIENMNIAMGALRYEIPEPIWQDVDRRYRDLLTVFAVRSKALEDRLEERRQDAIEMGEAMERRESTEE